MRSPAEHVNASFAQQVQAFAAELDRQARERYPAVVAQAMAAYGVPKEGMSAREAAFVDALVAGILQVVGEIVGLAMRTDADILIDALSKGSLGFEDGG